MYSDYRQNNQIEISFYQFNVKTLSKYLILHWEIYTHYKGKSAIINRNHQTVKNTCETTYSILNE